MRDPIWKLNWNAQKWGSINQQLTTNGIRLENLIADKSSKNTTVSTSYKCQLDLAFYVNPSCLCASHHRQLTWCANDTLGDASHFPGAFRIPTQTRKSHSCPLLLSPYSCTMSFETKWQAEMSCWNWRTYQLTFWQKSWFFSVSTDQTGLSSKKNRCAGTWPGRVNCQQGSLGYVAQIHPSRPIQAHPGPSRPIQAHPGPSRPIQATTPQICRMFWSISALLQRTNHAMLRSPARYTCPNQDVNSPGSNHRILEIPLFLDVHKVDDQFSSPFLS